jgi:uncharacterized protein YbjT (DUF2867 family)
VRVLSRRSREAKDGIEFVTGDLATGEGIQPAVDGVATIVHLAGSPKGDADLTRNLVRAASRAGGDAPGVHLGRWRRPHPRGEPR